MEAPISLLALIAGLLVRLAIPVAVTALLVFFLHKLDARWQEEAENQPLPVPRLECWKIKGCSPSQRKHFAAVSSPLPCWQVYRLPNGYLREECLSCKVFIDAPLPSLRIQPRRM